MSHLPTLLRRSFLVAVCVAATSGCYAEATTGADIEYAQPVANVEVYPHEYYDGRVVYLVGDRWYYHDGPHWVYYRTEPRPLYERRVVIQREPTVVHERAVVHRAPPAPRRYYSAPPAHMAPVRTAPPARMAPVRTAPPVERREYRVQ